MENFHADDRKADQTFGRLGGTQEGYMPGPGDIALRGYLQGFRMCSGPACPFAMAESLSGAT